MCIGSLRHTFLFNSCFIDPTDIGLQDDSDDDDDDDEGM